MTELNPPTEITLFLDRLHAAGQRVVEGSRIEFVRHPTKAGQWVGIVEVEDREDERPGAGE